MHTISVKIGGENYCNEEGAIVGLRTIRRAGNVRPAVAPSASLRRRPCERDQGRRRLRSDSALRACAHKCRLRLRFFYSPDPGVLMEGRERASETAVRKESHPTSKRSLL